MGLPSCCYSSLLSFFFPCFCPSPAAHLNPRLSEAESGVFPILMDTQSEPSVSQDCSTVALQDQSLTLQHFLLFNNSPGGDSCLVIGRAVHCVDPAATTQHIHWLCSWKLCGRPLPCVSHHVVQSCRKNPHCGLNIMEHRPRVKLIQTMLLN